MKKEIALIPKITQALKEVMAASGSTLPMPSGIDVLSEKLAKALTETYDSKEDPIVLAYIATTIATLGGNLANGQVAIPSGSTYVFTHGLGFVPHVTIVGNADSNATITSLTDTTVTLYHWHPSGNTSIFRVICS